jgi:predicted anti-sigma-YlaC factor YlaD
MHPDPTNHEAARAAIDKSLAGAASAAEEHSLREHLAACAACSEYLEVGRQAIAGLGGLRFEVDPTLDLRVMASLAARAEQLEAKRAARARFGWSCGLALLLTSTGSFTVALLGGHAAAAFHVTPAQLQFGLATFWVAPSLCVCLLFALLPWFANGRSNKEGMSL